MSGDEIQGHCSRGEKFRNILRIMSPKMNLQKLQIFREFWVVMSTRRKIEQLKQRNDP